MTIPKTSFLIVAARFGVGPIFSHASVYTVAHQISSTDAFSYDTFSLGEGRRSSFRYQRVEQARHDRNAMVAEAEANPNISVQICETAAEFRQQVATAGEPAACEEAKAGG